MSHSRHLEREQPDPSWIKTNTMVMNRLRPSWGDPPSPSVSSRSWRAQTKTGEATEGVLFLTKWINETYSFSSDLWDLLWDLWDLLWDLWDLLWDLWDLLWDLWDLLWDLWDLLWDLWDLLWDLWDLLWDLWDLLWDLWDLLGIYGIYLGFMGFTWDLWDETNSKSTWKWMVGRLSRFLLGQFRPIFRCKMAVSFRGVHFALENERLLLNPQSVMEV